MTNNTTDYQLDFKIRRSVDRKILSLDEYLALLPDDEEISAFVLADGFIYCEGDTVWFSPAPPFDFAALGMSLLDVLLWDVEGYQSGDRDEWQLSKETRANLESLLAVLKQAQTSIEYALAHDVGEGMA